jgi:SnoaL-like domain
MIKHVSISSRFLARPLSKSGEADLLSAGDRLDMLDLIHTFGWCIDAQAYDVLGTIITEEFVHDNALALVEGRDEFILSLKTDNSFAGLRHENSNPVLRSVDLSNAIAVSYLSLIRVDAGVSALDSLPEVVVHAVCTDIMKKEKEIWKLDKRILDQMSVSARFAGASSREKFALTAKERQTAKAPQG